MIENRIKRVWREGGLALASCCGALGTPAMVELIALSGFDGVRIDMEHQSYDLREVQMMVIMAERMGITPIVRTPGLDPGLILRLLDMGVQVIFIPHIDGAEGARKAVEAVFYPPLGDRGMMPVGRVAEYGRIPIGQYMEQANREVLLHVSIEDLKALEEVDEIAATKGIGLIGVGPSDLSRALGVAGQVNHPKLVAAIERVAEAARKSNNARFTVPEGFSLFPRTMSQLRDMGVSYTCAHPAPEGRLLKALSQRVSEIRKELGQKPMHNILV